MAKPVTVNEVLDGQVALDRARRTNQARGRGCELVTTRSGLFGPGIAGNVLLPGEGARITQTRFDRWLAGQDGPV